MQHLKRLQKWLDNCILNKPRLGSWGKTPPPPKSHQIQLVLCTFSSTAWFAPFFFVSATAKFTTERYCTKKTGCKENVYHHIFYDIFFGGGGGRYVVHKVLLESVQSEIKGKKSLYLRYHYQLRTNRFGFRPLQLKWC
ncbi:UNVERIFIED_CONTAM: hypothetical protein K2H54_066364 [Gekko kuhli]